MSRMIKRNIPIGLSAFFGIMFILDYFLNIQSLNNIVGVLRDWVIILTAESIIVAVITFWIRYSKQITRAVNESNYENMLTSGVALILFLVAVVPGVIYGTGSSQFVRLYQMFFPPSHATMWAMNAFFLASSSYRAFKARNVEAFLLLTTASITMLSLAPLTSGLWSGFEAIQVFLSDSFLTGAERAIAIGGAIGVISIGIRTILGFERSYMGERGEE
jgi:hypothetical protein